MSMNTPPTRVPHRLAACPIACPQTFYLPLLPVRHSLPWLEFLAHPTALCSGGRLMAQPPLYGVAVIVGVRLRVAVVWYRIIHDLSGHSTSTCLSVSDADPCLIPECQLPPFTFSFFPPFPSTSTITFPEPVSVPTKLDELPSSALSSVAAAMSASALSWGLASSGSVAPVA